MFQDLFLKNLLYNLYAELSGFWNSAIELSADLAIYFFCTSDCYKVFFYNRVKLFKDKDLLMGFEDFESAWFRKNVSEMTAEEKKTMPYALSHQQEILRGWQETQNMIH